MSDGSFRNFWWDFFIDFPKDSSVFAPMIPSRVLFKYSLGIPLGIPPKSYAEFFSWTSASIYLSIIAKNSQTFPDGISTVQLLLLESSSIFCSVASIAWWIPARLNGGFQPRMPREIAAAFQEHRNSQMNLQRISS